MNELKVSHLAFSDESHWNRGRYRGIGLVTIGINKYEEANKQIISILNESNIEEIKWQKIQGAKYRFAALKLCEFAINSAINNILRIDVLIWDIEDSRHKIKKRDDIANLQRMYYHLFKYVLKECWPDNLMWELRPDDHHGIDWQNLKNFLSKKEIDIGIVNIDLFKDKTFKLLIRHAFHISDICPKDSKSEPFIQLADFFVGLVIFSREHYEKFKLWKNKKGPQLSLIEQEVDNISISENERFQILDSFNQMCKKNKLQISLDGSKGLRSKNPNKHINFWWYEPQHDEDKAPTK
jgi:hypothetical protein